MRNFSSVTAKALPTLVSAGVPAKVVAKVPAKVVAIHDFSFVPFVVMRGKRWLYAVPRASLSVLTIVVIKRCITFDVSTKYNIPLKEDRIDPRLRKNDIEDC